MKYLIFSVIIDGNCKEDIFFTIKRTLAFPENFSEYLLLFITDLLSFYVHNAVANNKFYLFTVSYMCDCLKTSHQYFQYENLIGFYICLAF